MSTQSASMPPALERRLKYAGPALFSYGFRPFFLGGHSGDSLCRCIDLAPTQPQTARCTPEGDVELVTKKEISRLAAAAAI